MGTRISSLCLYLQSNQLVWAKHPKEATSNNELKRTCTRINSCALVEQIQGQDASSLSKSSITSMSFRDVIFCTYPIPWQGMHLQITSLPLFL